MRVVRGALPDVDADRRVTRRLLDRTERTDEPTLRVWRPPRQLAFGRRDSALDGYERAREIAADRGYAPIDRSAGGSAVAYTGTTVAFAIAVPVESGRGWGDIESRYRETVSDLTGALEAVGATVTRGEPDGSFCPGEHSLQGTGKVAGVAQRVRRESALVGGCVLTSKADERAVSRVLEPVYATLGLPFDPNAVGSVEGAGGDPDSERLVEAIEAAFVGDRETASISAAETLGGDCP